MQNSIPWITDNNELNPTLTSFYERFSNTLDDNKISSLAKIFNESPELLSQFHLVVETSKYIADKFTQSPTLLVDLLSEGHLNTAYALKDYQSLTEALKPSEDLDDDIFDRNIRDIRTKAMTRIIWRDFNRLANTLNTTHELSFLAETCIQRSLDYHYHHLSLKHGKPQNNAGEEQPLLILGMGKLGAYELNLSSDIDLIFAYPESGYTSDKDNAIDNQAFFNRLGKRLIKSLDANIGGTFVFRVDMRLRPYGQSGALVSNFASLEDYYQSQGREWERYAMIKARVVATSGDERYTDELQSMLRSFTYRKYVDFSVIEALRDLKAMIRQEVKRRRLEEDVKLIQL